MDLTKSAESPLVFSLLQALPHPAMLINQSKEVVAANKLAIEAGAIIGQFCWQTFGKAASLSDEHQQLLFENPEPEGVHCTFCRADACLENLHEENDPNVNVLGKTLDTYWVAIDKNIYLHYAIDVTEQIETQVAKNEAEESLRLILDSTAEGIYGLDRFGNCTFCNQRCLELLGYQFEDELLGRNMHELIHHTRQDGSPLSVKDCRVSQIFDDGKPLIDKDAVFWKADGTSFPVECWSYPMEREGEVVGAVVTFLDITERKQAEEEIRRSHKLLAETGEIGKVGGWEIDLDTGENCWTEELYHIHEVSLTYEPTIERGIGFYSEASQPVIKEAVQRAIEYNESYDLELDITTAKGNLRNVRAVGIPDVENRRLYGFFQDITEMKRLQSAQLRSSQLAALGEVAAGVAHEINNPINGIINYAQLLINKNDAKDKSNQILEKIIKEGSRISDIVHNLLNFAQKDRGEFSYLDLIDVIIEPIQLQSQLFKKDGIHVGVEIPDDLPQIYGNRMQLKQVVLNLLSNARHALNKKFPETSNEKFIVIEAKLSSAHNVRCVELRVKDTGCGIPKDHLEKIFNPFFTTKEAGVGTGLGLSVSHDILEKHGAKISVDSQMNKYTETTITFPVKLQ